MRLMTRLVFQSLLLLSLLWPGTVGVVQAGINVWTSNGPEGGAVSALAIDPSNTNTIYAGATGGVFKSTDAGANWSAAGAGLANTGVSALAIDPSSVGTIYAGTLGIGGSAFKSTNGGGTWGPINTGLRNADRVPSDVFALAIDPSNTQTIYAGTGDGIFKSIDGGAGWNAVNKV